MEICWNAEANDQATALLEECGWTVCTGPCDVPIQVTTSEGGGYLVPAPATDGKGLFVEGSELLEPLAHRKDQPSLPLVVIGAAADDIGKDGVHGRDGKDGATGAKGETGAVGAS